MNATDLVKMYEFSYGAINRNLDGLSHAESLVLPPSGNCLNWVLGHVILSRGLLLTLTGGTPVLSGSQSEPYKRGSSCGVVDGLLDLATLRGLLADSQQQLIPGLAAMSDEALAGSMPEPYNRPPLRGSVVEAFGRLHYHESYHNGQIGLLRRIAGKEGAIR
jgi:DinB superfamily